MNEQFLKAMHPVTAVLHWKILSILKQYDIKTVLDVGGTGKLNGLGNYSVMNANITDNIDGCNLPHADDRYDAVVSVATLEHVHDQTAFLDECERVARTVSVHWFPFGPYAEMAEQLKKKYGHWHPCSLPDKDIMQRVGCESEEFMTWGEHMLLCMTLTPTLKVREVYDMVIEKYYLPYGLILKRDE